MKEKVDIVFLILHYNTIYDTRKCIESIKKYIHVNYRIVVVDNNSLNKSGVSLKSEYENDKTIEVILSSKNLGFANGNNLGFEYIHKNFDTDFVVMLNNDTYLLDDNFYELVKDEYENSHYAVMGPKILLPDNKVNPIQKELISLKELKRRVFRLYVNYYCNLFYISFIYDGLKKIFLKKRTVKSYYNMDGVDERQEDIVLHGAFLIFSKKYFEQFNGLDSRTFMYMEEKMLAAKLKKCGLKSVYNPKIVIFHNEDSATNSIKKTKRSKNLFVYKNAIKSSKVLIKELETM